MISIDNISVRFGGFTLLDRISMQVGPRERIGLVGRNGAGKTTLMRMMAGKSEGTEGKVVISSDSTVGYLPQQMKHLDGKSVYDEAMNAFEEVLKMENRIAEINEEISRRTDYDSAEYLKLIDRMTTLSEQFELMGGNSLHGEVEKTLLGLGFVNADMQRQTSEFSGGWRMRIELAKLLLRKPDYILLDEPTNHLDIESIQWLEDYLRVYTGGVVLISHDRTFLDNVTNRTVEISLGKLIDYRVPYSKFMELREERREHESAAFSNQQKMIKETEEFIERFRYKATKAVQVQSRIKQLEKLERLEVEEEDKSGMHIKFPPAPRSGRIVVKTEALSKAYGNHQVLKDIDLVIERGEKVAFVGKNGEGKSTLSKIISGELDYKGQLKMGHNVDLGYFAQNQDEILDENKTVFETIDTVAVGDMRTKVRDILGAFLFSGENVDKKVRVLSGGERNRLSLAQLLLQEHNLLLMDEPTNHLDMRSKDILKNALAAFDGTLIVVSHDRDFLDGLVDKVFEFSKQKVKEHLGGIYEFLDRKKMETLRELEKNTRSDSQEKEKKEKISDNKEYFLKKKEFDRKLKKLRQKIERMELKISDCENELDGLNKQMETSGHKLEPEKFIRYEVLQKELEKWMEEWEQSQIEYESLKEQSF